MIPDQLTGILKRTLGLVLFFAGTQNINAQSYDFIFNLKNVLEPHAQHYLVERQNVIIFHEPFFPQNSYWGAAENDKPGKLTFRFPLKKPMASGRMIANIAVANFENAQALGKGKGEVSIWYSRTGRDWKLLSEMKPPPALAFDGITVSKPLPNDLKGTTEIWLQVRFQATGMHKKTYSVAQFCRDNCADPNGTIFDVRVKYARSASELVAESVKRTKPQP